MPQGVLSFRNTKYRQPNAGGGLPTTNVFSSAIFISAPPQNTITFLNAVPERDEATASLIRSNG